MCVRALSKMNKRDIHRYNLSNMMEEFFFVLNFSETKG